MEYKLRYYQQEGVDKAVDFLRSKTQGNAIEVFPTGAGKSLIIDKYGWAVWDALHNRQLTNVNL